MKFWTHFWMLLVFVAIGFGFCMLFSVGSGVLIALHHEVVAMHLLQWSQTVFVMMLAPLCWYRFYHLKAERPSWRRCLDEARMTNISWQPMAVTFCLMMAALPAFDSLEVMMNRLPWPEPIHNYIINGFETNQKILVILLGISGFWGWVESFLLMCLCTAMGEELMFRGALLSCFRNQTRLNMHAIAWMVGFIFAFIHFEPAGFVVRWLLGVLLVYLVWWTGSLWPSILAHCMNNTFALIGYWMATPEEQMQLSTEYTFGPVLTIASVVVACLLLRVLWQMRAEKTAE